MEKFDNEVINKYDYIRKKFLRFLKEEKIFEKYMKNVKFYNSCKYPVVLTKCYQSYISGAFAWDRTNEGHFYWSNYSKKWRKILEQL